jgi:16S rRNA (guanine1207-N2)-methyltransferase
MMEADLVQLNQRAAAFLLEQMAKPESKVFLADAVWPLKPRPQLAHWQRRGAATDFSVWQGDFAGALLGLPRARDELEMNVHLVAARLRPQAPLVLFGLKDAGIAPAEKLLQNLFAETTCALTKHHGRVFIAKQPYKAKLRADIEGWRSHADIVLDAETIRLASYPGLFAAGKLDAASALLLAQLPSLPMPKILLDYACGTGVLALGARRLWSQARLHLVDHDALALRAARDNVPGLEYIHGEALSVCSARYDLIISNPPIHAGRKQDYSVVERLVGDAPLYLTRGGRLVLVAQQTVPVQRWAKTATVLVQAEGFRVWQI